MKLVHREIEPAPGSAVDSPVAIVGAGPVGMACALRLAQFGVQSVILEANADLLPQGSKACLIQGDVLEILDKCGCAAPISKEGVPWRIGHTYVRGREIRRSEYPVRPGFCEFVNISQYRIEQILREAAERDPSIRFLWSTRVTAVSDEAGATCLEFATPDGPDSLSARYVVAADGVHSIMRRLLGVRWLGYTHKDRFLITDIRAKLPYPRERHFHYDPPFNPGRQLVIHPQPDDVWRIDWQLAPGADIESEMKDGRFDRRVRAVIGDIPYEVVWWSTYRFHQRVVSDFRVGDVFFAGDSAHALPPYGSRGMNSGIQDADNLAWKIGAVLNGSGSEALLDSYHHERRAAAEENLRVTEATIRFMVPPNPFVAVYRKLVLAASRFSAGMRDRVDSGRMAQPFRYAPSDIVVGSAPDPLLGSFAPDMLLEAAGGAVRLRTLLGHGFVWLFLPRSGDRAARDFGRGAGLPVLTLIPVSAPPPHGMDRVYRFEELPAEFAGSPHDLFLVRPDGHVAAAFNAAQSGDLGALVRRASGTAAAPPVGERPLAPEQSARAITGGMR